MATEKVQKEETKKENYDFVNHPNHYNGHKILAKKTKNSEKEEMIYETIDFLDSTAIRMSKVLKADELHSYIDSGKYYDRCGDKPEQGKSIRRKAWEDINKIIWYMKHCADLMEKNGLDD